MIAFYIGHTHDMGTVKTFTGALWFYAPDYNRLVGWAESDIGWRWPHERAQRYTTDLGYTETFNVLEYQGDGFPPNNVTASMAARWRLVRAWW